MSIKDFGKCIKGYFLCYSIYQDVFFAGKQLTNTVFDIISTLCIYHSTPPPTPQHPHQRIVFFFSFLFFWRGGGGYLFNGAQRDTIKSLTSPGRCRG